MRDVKKTIEDAISICSEAVARPSMGAESTAQFASAAHDMTVTYMLLFSGDRVQNDPNAWPQQPVTAAKPEEDR